MTPTPMTPLQMVIAIVISAVITFSLRALPFVIFHGNRKMPKWLERIEKSLPAMIMSILIIYCLKDIGDKYDLIILDPPAFAKHHKVLGNAMQGYKRLNARALSQIRPGGILFTFSCSQAVTKELFRTTVFSAAAIAGRKVRILHQLTQPADHPINIYHPEGEYLKGLVLYVE